MNFQEQQYYSSRNISEKDMWKEIIKPFLREGYVSRLVMQYTDVEVDKALSRAFIGNNPTKALLDAFDASLIDDGLDLPQNITIEDKSKIAIWFTNQWYSQASDFGVYDFTPWTMEDLKANRSIFHGLVATQRKTLPVLLVHADKRYIHKMTEELIVGILSVLDGYPQFTFYLNDVVTAGVQNPESIKLQDIVKEYLSDRKRNLEKMYSRDKYDTQIYKATVKGIKYSFETVDFIRGVITAARWINKNPKDFIIDITKRGIPITF